MLKNKLTKKNLLISMGVITICFMFTFLTYNLNNPTRVNKLLASVLNSNPANPAFDDENFYELVIDAYNNQTGSSKAYTDSLTDSELAQIDIIANTSSSAEDKIISLKGIEKLTGLSKLSLNNHSIETVDLSSNTNLDYISIVNSNLNEINLSNNTNLEFLDLSNNNISEINLSNNTNLEDLSLYNNNIGSVNNIVGLYNLVNLTFLNLLNTGLNSINLNGLTDLEVLDLSNNNISEINLSNNTNLIRLDLSNNNISEINLSNNTNLEDLSLYNNNIGSVNNIVGLYNLVNLTALSLNENNIDEIDVSNLTNLEFLDLSNNNISEIDLSNNTNLIYLYLGSNQLNEIDVSALTNLTDLSLSWNNLNEINLSNNINLTGFNVYNERYYEVGKEYDFPVVLPSSYTLISYDTNNSNIIENGKIKPLTSGIISNLYITYVAPNNNYYDTINIGLVYTYKVTSDKYNINSNLNVISVGQDNDDEISNNIYTYGSGVIYRYIEDNTLRICKGSEQCDKLLSEYKLIKYYSDKYDLSLGYIIDNDNTFDINDITVETGDVEVTYDNNNVKITYGDTIIDEIPVISYSSNKYNLSENYIYIRNDTFDIDDIVVSNCDKQVEDNNLIITYNGNEILRKPIIRYETDYNIINNSIYLGTNDFDSSKFNVVNAYTEYSSDGIIIYDNVHNSIVGIMPFISLTSSHYSLNNEYINIGTGELNLEYINKSSDDIALEENNNRLQVKNGNRVLQEWQIVSYSSSKYDLNMDYIYIGNNVFDLENIVTANCDKKIENNNLVITYNGNEILRKPIIRYETDYDVVNNYIYLGTNVFDSSRFNVINGYANIYDDNIEIVSSDYVYVGEINLVKVNGNYDMSNEYVYLGNNSYDYYVNVTNGYTSESDNKIKIYGNNNHMYEEKTLVSLSSDYYEINEDYNYIYTGYEVFDIEKVNKVNCTIEAYDTYINIIYNNEVIRRYDLVSIIAPSKYNLSNGYIYTGSNEFEIDRVRTINCDKYIDENNNLVITYNGNEILRKPIISISSNYYNLNKNYIYVGNNSFNDNDISITNGNITYDDNYVYINDYNNNQIESIPLYRIYSNVYDLSNNYIYVGTNDFNVDYIETNGCSKEYKNGILQIKYENQVLEEKDIVGIASNKYDLTNSYIYTGDKEFEIAYIGSMNGNLYVNNNVLQIEYGGTILEEKPIVSVISEEYNLSRGYIYLGANNLDVNNINCINCNIEEQNNNMLVMYEGNIVDRIDEVKVISSKYDLNKTYIKAEEEIDLNDIEVINGSKEYIDNKLYIKVGSKVVKEYDVDITERTNTTETTKKTTESTKRSTESTKSSSTKSTTKTSSKSSSSSSTKSTTKSSSKSSTTSSSTNKSKKSSTSSSTKPSTKPSTKSNTKVSTKSTNTTNTTNSSIRRSTTETTIKECYTTTNTSNIKDIAPTIRKEEKRYINGLRTIVIVGLISLILFIIILILLNRKDDDEEENSDKTTN